MGLVCPKHAHMQNMKLVFQKERNEDNSGCFYNEKGIRLEVFVLNDGETNINKLSQSTIILL